jgi:hypothetical protein
LRQWRRTNSSSGIARLELRDNADVEPFRKESATHSLTPQDGCLRGKEGAGERAFFTLKRRQPGISAAVPGQIGAGRGDGLTNAGRDGERVWGRACRHADERLLPCISGHFSRLVAFSCKTGHFSYKTTVRKERC